MPADRTRPSLCREVDPAKGPFEPTPREPIKDERNPRGTRHVLKTMQDRLPVKQRRRYQEWRERRGRS